jgi:hypothetical protein
MMKSINEAAMAAAVIAAAVIAAAAAAFKQKLSPACCRWLTAANVNCHRVSSTCHLLLYVPTAAV